MVYAIFVYSYARKGQGLGTAFKEGAGWLRGLAATLITLAACVGLMRLEGLALMAAAWLVAVLAATFLSRRLGGLTGDAYGAINEVVQVAVLILIPLITWSYDI